MTTCNVDAIGCISTGMVSPWIAACSMCSRTGWVGDSCACGPSSIAMWWRPPAMHSLCGCGASSSAGGSGR